MLSGAHNLLGCRRVFLVGTTEEDVQVRQFDPVNTSYENKYSNL